jgi:hypothetical protein
MKTIYTVISKASVILGLDLLKLDNGNGPGTCNGYTVVIELTWWELKEGWRTISSLNLTWFVGLAFSPLNLTWMEAKYLYWWNTRYSLDAKTDYIDSAPNCRWIHTSPRPQREEAPLNYKSSHIRMVGKQRTRGLTKAITLKFTYMSLSWPKWEKARPVRQNFNI